MTQQVSVAISTLGGTSLTILSYIAKYNVFDTGIQFKDITGEKKKKKFCGQILKRRLFGDHEW